MLIPYPPHDQRNHHTFEVREGRSEHTFEFGGKNENLSRDLVL